MFYYINAPLAIVKSINQYFTQLEELNLTKHFNLLMYSRFIVSRKLCSNNIYIDCKSGGFGGCSFKFIFNLYAKKSLI